MDKYEFNIKVEQIRKLVNKGDYGTAMKIADTIDWKKVHNANLLSMVQADGACPEAGGCGRGGGLLPGVLRSGRG